MRNLTQNRLVVNLGIALAVLFGLALLFLLTPYSNAPELDDADSRLQFLTILVLIGYVVLLALVVQRVLNPFGKKFLVGLATLQIAWAIIHLITRHDLNFAEWFFQPSIEYGSGAIFSSTLLLLISLSAAWIALFGRHAAPLHRAYWIFISIGFLFLAADEYYSIHETYEFWRTGYMAVGAGVVLLSALMYWFGYRQQWHVFLLIIVGFGFMGFSGVVMDAFANDAPLEFGPIATDAFRCAHFEWGVACQSFPIIEEFLELVGEGFILLGVISFAGTFIPENRWRTGRRLMVALGSIWVVWTLFSLLGLEMLEAQLNAESYEVSYLDGALTFDGYELSHSDRIKPGDTISGTFYFTAHEGIPANYYLSVHLLDKPDESLMAQSDLQLGDWKIPTSAWLPGVTVGTDMSIDVPEDLPTPATYWLMVRVWKGPDLEDGVPLGQDLVIEQEGLRLIKPDTFIIKDLAGLSDNPLPEPPQQVSYHFNDGFTLFGYDMPATASDELTIRFWWKDERRTRQLIHFVHLFQVGGDAVFTFDHQSFDGTFPPEDWLPGISIMDEWTIELPADMPAGEYEVRTGMYEYSTTDRVIVTDDAGEVVPDYSIVLGTVTIENN